MERLTIRLNPATNRCTKVSTDLCYEYDNCFDCPQYKAMVDRLAAYEDTGLEPEEIKANMEMLHSYRHVCVGLPPDHIRELVQAEQDGRLVVLKCAADVPFWRTFGKDIALSRFDGFEINDDGEKHWLCGDEFFGEDDFCKTVFLTREEAEAALKGGTDHA